MDSKEKAKKKRILASTGKIVESVDKLELLDGRARWIEYKVNGALYEHRWRGIADTLHVRLHFVACATCVSV